MPKISKETIMDTYHEAVKRNGGVPVGEAVFLRETGISRYSFRGGYWRSWSAFQAAAGYEPNKPTEKIPDETLLRAFAELALERNAIPTFPDLILKRKDDPSFPGIDAFRRWGSQGALVANVVEYCDGKKEFAPVLALLTDGV